MIQHIPDDVSPERFTISISLISHDELPDAVSLIVDSMATNPVNEAVFGYDDQALEKQKKMFTRALAFKGNNIYVAKMNGRMIGVMCYMNSDHCQLKPIEMLKMLPSLWSVLGNSLFKVLQWRFNWKKHDYKKPHIHFGPIAVAQHVQGSGAGSALLKVFCDKMDQDGQVAYLETDKEINLRLYQRFGFRIVEKDEIFKVRNWFMVRYPITPHKKT